MHTYWLALRVIFFSPRYISPPHASCLFRYRDEFSINFSIISPPPPLPPCILRPSLFLRTFLVLFLYENRERNSVLFLARVINSVLFRIVVAFFFIIRELHYYYSRLVNWRCRNVSTGKSIRKGNRILRICIILENDKEETGD